MKLTTQDIRINGYPPLDTILAHFDAMPVLVASLRALDPVAFALWDIARQAPRPAYHLLPVSRRAEKAFDLDEVLGV